MAWEPAEKVQKNKSGQYRALIGGEWVPVAKAQKSPSGQYRIDRGVEPEQAQPQVAEQIPPEQPSLTSQVGRQLGLTGRAAIEGIGDIVGIAQNPLAAMSGGAIRRTSEVYPELATKLGLPQAETPTQQFVQAAGRGITGAGAGVGLGGMLSAAPKVAGQFGSFMAAQPAAQAASAIGGAGGAELARQGGLGPAGQVVGGVLGALSPTALARGLPAAGRAATGRPVAAIPEEQAQVANLAELARVKTLKELPVPITEQDVIRSQITRQYPQQEAERLVAGQPIIGSELAARLQRGQEKMLANIDALYAKTGAKAASPEVAGETVRTWAQNIYGAAKKDTQAAYKYAKELHGEKQFHPSDELVSSLVENRAMPGYQELFNQAQNMGLIVPKKDGGFTAGRVTVNELDKFKSIASRTSQSIDGNTSYAGGDIVNKVYSQLDNIAPEFREAAKIRRRQGQMFEEPTVTQKILGTTTGRLGKAEETIGGLTIPEYKVASEKLINTIVNSSNQDLRYVRNLALTGTREQKQQGIQAIREMRGSVISGLRDKWEGTQTPQAKANQVEKYFEKIGNEKIETLFGKAGAKEIQKFRDAADIVNRGVPSPEGGSQSVGRLMIMGGKLIDMLEKVPVAGSGVAQTAKLLKGTATAAAGKQIPKKLKPKSKLAELAFERADTDAYLRSLLYGGMGANQ